MMFAPLYFGLDHHLFETMITAYIFPAFNDCSL